MLVKKTKKGQFAFALKIDDRSCIFSALCNFLEDESVKLWQVGIRKEADVMRHLYYSTLDELINRKNFFLQSNHEIKWTITRAEAVALMWLLRHHDDKLSLLELKSGLHKTLQP